MTHRNKRYKHLPSLVACALLCAAPTLHAAPVSLHIANASISAGSGYGVDTGTNGENGGTLLDVAFDNAFVAQAFSFASVGDRVSFNFATISLNEPNTGKNEKKSIRNAELDDLGVTARFNFTSAVSRPIDLTAIVTATAGLIDDSDVDYAIAWTPVEADFGAGGRFRVSVNDLSFSTTGVQTALATVELLSAPDLRVTAVPEPASIALVGVALAGVGAVRRRRVA